MNATLGACALALVCAAAGCKKESPTTTVEAATPQSQPAAKENADPFGRMTVDELEARLKDPASKGKLHIFDANSKSRFDQGHIPTATWIKFNDVKAEDLPPQKDAPLVFYCANEH